MKELLSFLRERALVILATLMTISNFLQLSMARTQVGRIVYVVMGTITALCVVLLLSRNWDEK